MWKEHTTYGYYFANENNIPREISQMIFYHHENWDGSGFPKGLKGTDIPIGARIVSVCSTYSESIVAKNQEPYEAIEFLYGTGGIYFDKDVVDVFTSSIAVYPLGAIVRLSTKEVGVVVNVRKNKGPRPVVSVYYNRVNKKLSKAKIIDLGQENTIFIEGVLG